MVEVATRLVFFLDQILQQARKEKGHIIIRQQRCIGCHSTLAVEITDKLGSRGEYWVIKDFIKTKFGTDLLYGKEVWFGNTIKCFNCGRVGTLPIDKPLTAEQQQLPKEIKDGTANNT